VTLPTVFSCDPGAKRLACAIAYDRVVVWAGFVAAWDYAELARFPTPRGPIDAIFEKMIVRPGQSSAAVANDLIDVHGSACWLAGQLRPRSLHWVCPEYWKGQLPKPQHHALIWAAMLPQERALFPADTGDYIDRACHRMAVRGGKATGYSRESHNLLDAVGLNFFHTSRTGRAGAPIY
jgi:hypothetical protein